MNGPVLEQLLSELQVKAAEPRRIVQRDLEALERLGDRAGRESDEYRQTIGDLYMRWIHGIRVDRPHSKRSPATGRQKPGSHRCGRHR
ncbi:MAG: hypothetical protein Greene041619_267 [Candidatus Peregrinibacteria bacterium Greene0416_19]|nr:MAG: hypothetical protein Greene041619_267 [Candidatus Peregrinibacteria bacterium Greene0416_19]